MRYNLGWQNVILPKKNLIVSIVLIWSLTFQCYINLVFVVISYIKKVNVSNRIIKN